VFGSIGRSGAIETQADGLSTYSSDTEYLFVRVFPDESDDGKPECQSLDSRRNMVSHAQTVRVKIAGL
jgi:hypothetical protein